MRGLRMGMAAALLALGGAAWADGPAGLGSLGLGMEWTPSYVQNNQTSDQKAYQLTGDFPVWSGVQAQLGAMLGYSHSQSQDSFFGESTTDRRDWQVYGWDASLNVYPAAFAGKAFVPGENANPDGWLLWPSMTLGYAMDKMNSEEDHVYYGGLGDGQDTGATFDLIQSMQYGLTLPLATWLSVEGSYSRNLSLDESYSNISNTRQTGGIDETEGAALNVYLNLVPGAGADKSRPYLPHFGRLGQLLVQGAWNRTIYPGAYPQINNNYSLWVGAPVSSSLSVAVGAAQDNSGSHNNQDYSAKLTWAFGDPEGRLGR